ncbi:SCO family protein [Pseudoalteromonas sp. T1lg65]|uniref:SCO family protein n=1 Tax=Pseudoalteromonas sp. T1lg65 TaxID=2077101 RepID=UPI003F7B1936
MRNTLLLSFLLTLLACTPQPELTDKTVWYKQAKTIKPFTLYDQNGNAATNQQFTGKWNLLFLGYTHCPDVCPMTLLKLTQLYRSLDNQDDVQVWFVSVDPNRDTQQRRLDYIKHFNPAFLAVSAKHDVLYPFVRELGLMYALNDTSADEYYVDHSGSVALVNPSGELEAIFKPEFEAGKVPTINVDTLLNDLRVIIK